MRLRLLIAACVAGSLLLFPASGVAQTVPEAPQAVTVVSGNTSLTVSWTAPGSAGGSAITAYDLRYILSDASDKADDQWTVVDPPWSSGTLQYEITTLTRDTSYDLEVRAVNASGDGPWSDTSTQATSDHADSRGGAERIALGASVPGRIDPADEDWFSITLSEPTGVYIYSTSQSDLSGALVRADGSSIAMSYNSGRPGNTLDFSLPASLGAGTYYLAVTAGATPGRSTGAYVVHFTTANAPGDSFDSALSVTPNVPVAAHFSTFHQQHFFTFELSSAADIWITTDPPLKTIGTLYDSDRNQVTFNVGPHNPIPGSFEIRAGLSDGTYYVQVGANPSNAMGWYVLRARTVVKPGSTTETAADIRVHGIAAGHITSAADTEYFRLTVDRPAWVRLSALSSQPAAFTPAIFDSNDVRITGVFDVTSATPRSFDIGAFLISGIYYIQITSSDSHSQRYTLSAAVYQERQKLLDECLAFEHSYEDPYYGCQWHLNNTGQFGGADEDINVEDAWLVTLGAGANVAVVDGALLLDHPDLVDNLVTARNFSYHDGFGNPEEHSTRVAGLIAARDNDQGVRGVAPRASLHAIDLRPEVATAAQMADAMVRELQDTTISSNSWGPVDLGVPFSPGKAWEAAIERGVSEGFGGKGISYVWAGGNGAERTDDSNLDGRANHYGVTAVCAVQTKDTRSFFSEKGANLWVCAPSGGDELRGITTTDTVGYTADFGGTSASTPMVSGVIALMRSAAPALTWRDVKLILAETARKNDSANRGWEQGALAYGSTTERYSFNHEYGFGVVDAHAAVTLASQWSTRPSLPALREITGASGTGPLAIPDRPGNGSPTTVTSTLEVDNYVGFAEFVEINIDVDHESFRNLEIDLIAPSGNVSHLTYSGTGYLSIFGFLFPTTTPLYESFRLGSARHLGENPAGEWTLRVTDRIAGKFGTINSWSVTVYGHGLTPGFPPAPTATSGMRTLTIDWDAPTDIGGSAITSYDLQYIRSNASGKTDPANWTVVTGIGTDDTGTHEIAGLGPGAQYDVQVRAVNETGPGPWSESLVVRSSLEQPFAPSLTGVTPRDQGLGATWDAPTEDGGSEITSYDLRSSDATDEEKEDPANWDETFLAWTPLHGDLQGRVASLINGVEYDVQVRARNAIGEGDWSETLKGTPAIQNTDPTFTDDTADREVAEDLRVGGNVGARVAATDPDGDQLTYSILGGHDLFEIDAATGQLRVQAVLDADEGVTSHTLTVEVSDGLNSSDDEDPAIDDSIEVTVTVTNVNEPPLVEGARAIDHAENEGTALANARYSATDPERANIIWSLGGNDGGKFAISDSGVLSFAAEPDFDIKGDRNGDNIYEVTVQATEEDDGDADALTGTLAVTVTLSDFDEAPVIDGPASVADYPENSPKTTVVGRRYTAMDPEGAGVTWSDLSGNDAGKFEFSNTGMLTFKVSPNFEQQPEYEVTLNAFDGGFTGSLTVTVTIANENEPPTISGEVLVDFTENGTGTVEMYSAMDPDVGATQDWSLAGADGGDFEITNGVLTFINPPDYDMPTDDSRPYNEYLVTVQVNDGANTATRPVTVRVLDVNEAPTVSGNATPSVAENTTAVATYTATDPERATITWSVEDPGASDFTISNAGALSFASAPNYEVKSSYTVTVRASDGTNYDDHDVTVTVTNVDEDEVLTLSLRTPLIGEEFTAAFEEGTGDNVDNVQPPTWAWARSAMGSSSGWMPITDATNATYEPTGADRERYLRVTVYYNDGRDTKTLSATSEFATAATRASNTPPMFPDPLFTGVQTGLSVRENAGARTVVGVAPEATDMQGGTLRYSLAVSGFTSDPPFGINPSSRQIRVASGAVLNHEDEDHDRYSVTVTVTDEFDATDTATFDIAIEDVNEPPVAVADSASTNEGNAVTFEVLRNDTDPDDGDTLTATIASRPATNLGSVALDPDTYMVTYRPPDSDFNRTATFTYTASDGELSSLPALVTVTVDPVNDAPTFPAAPVERSVSEQANTGDPVGAPVVATDVDGDPLNYSLGGVDADSFEIDEFTGQLSTSDQARLNAGAQDTYIVTVTADDGSGEANATATVEVTITVTARPVIIITGGGGGGGGGGGPTPSEVDFEWTVDRDIEELEGGNDRATGVWSDGTTLWVADNADGAGDAVYAYDRASGERLTEREFALHETNRAPRGFWSDRSVVWVSDSGRERLFAYDLATGERLEDREFALAERNSDARGIWADEKTMWVLDGRADALFAYDFESGALLAEYALDAANDDPHGLWSDGVTIWVSDHGAKRLIAYRLPVLPDAEADPGKEDADDDPRELERVSDEEFTGLSKASNNSPRGIWSDGDVMYVADESDDRVYSYNMPDAIDARLASLTLSGVDIGEFSSDRTEYDAVVGEGVTATTVEAEAMQRRTTVAIDPPDADVEADGHQVALQDLGEITVTVTSQDGSRTRVYRVQFPDTGWDPARDPWPHCLRGAISEGFSLVVYEGGSVEELVSCAESRGIVALYALHEGVYVSNILGAPDFVNAGFLELFPDGLPPITPLVAASNGSPSADPFGDLDDGGRQPWPECLRGDIAAGFSLLVYEGGSVEELEACAQSRDVAALYALSDGVFVSNILGAPEFVTQPFRDLFADGLPPMTPLVARSEGPPGGR